MEIILALAITLAVEVNLFMLLDYENLKLFILVSIINIISNSSMNLILISVHNEIWYYIVLAIFEVSVVFLEAFFVSLFLKYKYTSALLFSFIANLASFLMGLLINQIVKTQTATIITIIIFMVIYFVGFGIFTYIASQEYEKRE